MQFPSHSWSIDILQDIFNIPEGAQGAVAELERRKFTAEEGVSY